MKLSGLICCAASLPVALIGCTQEATKDNGGREVRVSQERASKFNREDLTNLAEFAREFDRWETLRKTNTDTQVPIQYDLDRVKAVAQQFQGWWEEGKVPGFGKDVEGTVSAFPIWNQPFQDNLLTAQMQADIADCRDAYLVNVKTTNQDLHYLVWDTGTNLVLVSGYENLGGSCRKLPFDGLHPKP